jgi:perosamine synthetase
MIPFYRPYYDHLEILAALRSGLGRCEFESALAARARAEYGLAFSYGRAGIIAAFKALGIAQAEVILPAYTCLVMAHAVMASGNRPAFADIDLADYNVTVKNLKQALTSQTRAVVATHMYGYPTDVDAIRAAVGDGVIIIEDCALAPQVLSSTSNGLRGDLGLFSFGAGKPLSAYGGGALVTDSAEIYEKIKAYRDQEMHRTSFQSKAKQLKKLLTSYALTSKRIYTTVYRPKARAEVNRKFKLPADYMPSDITMAFPHFQARVGLVQLQKVDHIIARRRALVRLYDRELQDCPGLYPAPIVADATYAYYTIRVPRRDAVDFEGRMIRRGVAVDRSFHYALPYLQAYQPFARGEFPYAAQAAREVINLPCYPHLREDDARYIAASVLDSALARKI